MRRGLALAGLIAALATPPAVADARARRAHLTAFPRCSTFVHYARRHALRELKTMGVPGTVTPFPSPTTGPVMPQRTSGTTEGAAPQATAPDDQTDFSGTNVQEAGVDEPDIVKTDGKRIFAAEGNRLYAIDARGDAPKLVGSLDLPGYGAQLLLRGDKLLVLSGAGVAYGGPIVFAPPASGGGPTPARAATVALPYVASSTLSEVDVSDAAHMKVLKTMSVNGNYLDARLTGHTARVVFSAIPQAIPLLTRPPQQEQVVDPREVISRTTTPSWRPTYRIRRGTRGKVARHALVRCTAIAQPAQFSGLDSLTVLTIDLDKGLTPVDSDGVMTDAQTVYASKTALYVATQKAIVEQPNSDAPPPDQLTEIHKFDISDPDETRYVGSGAVSGTLLNQFSMSEQDGFLRVASTQTPLWWAGRQTEQQSESAVTVLAPRPGALVQVGKVGGLGKGQRIYAVRFIGDVGYVVTFRQVDPLYTVGLSDPAHPRVLGALDLLGYSAYLHPVGDGLLLGVGQAANDQGRVSGTQLSLFDVSDPAKPARLASHELGSGSSSTAEFDHHAFLWWDPAKLAVMPVSIYSYDQEKGTSDQFTGAIGFHVAKADGISEKGRLTHPQSQGYYSGIDRVLVIGSRLFSLSALGVKASDLATFADQGFAEFPQPAQPQPGATGGSGTGTAEPGQTVSSPPPSK